MFPATSWLVYWKNWFKQRNGKLKEKCAAPVPDRIGIGYIDTSERIFDSVCIRTADRADHLSCFPRHFSFHFNAFISIAAILLGGVIRGVGGLILFLPFVALWKIVSAHIDRLEPLHKLPDTPH